MVQVDGEDIICQGFLRTGEKIVFTNKRLQILEVQQVQSFEEVGRPKYTHISEFPIENVENVYSEVSSISGIAEMVVKLDDGKKLRCSFGILIDNVLFLGRSMISIPNYNAVVDRHIKKINTILERKRRKV